MRRRIRSAGSKNNPCSFLDDDVRIIAPSASLACAAIIRHAARTYSSTISRAPASATSPRPTALSDTATDDGIAFTTDEILASGSYETFPASRRQRGRQARGWRKREAEKSVYLLAETAWKGQIQTIMKLQSLECDD